MNPQLSLTTFMVRRGIYWDINIMISCPQVAKEAKVEGAV
jgi:hypothetical protein